MVSRFQVRRRHKSGHVYHWRHGWIPLTHAAALAKAHGRPKEAAKYVKPKRKTPRHITEYYAERQAQDRRFESSGRGGHHANDTSSQEYKDYYGTGDYRGQPVEQRYTYARHLERMRMEKAEHKARDTSYRAGFRLGKAHARGKGDTATENAEYDKAEKTVPSSADFDQGYSEGIAAGYEAKYARQKVSH